MLVHEAIAQVLSDHGVEVIFGVMGDANLFVVDSFVNRQHGQYVSAANEGGAALMGIGFASTSAGLGVATVTHGPGLTNTVTALVEAVRGRSHLLLLAGDTAAAARGNLQDVDQYGVVAGTGAGFVQPGSADSVVEDLRKAIAQIYSEHRPVVFNVPIDLMWEDVEFRPSDDSGSSAVRVDVDTDALDSAVGIVANAKRPIVLAGRGVVEAGARDAVLRLARRIGAPVATTIKAKDLFHGESANLGVFGTVTEGVAYDVVGMSDCVIAFGASLNWQTTAEGSLLAGKRVVQCDVDESRIGMLVPVDAAVRGDAGLVADTIVEWLDEAEIPSTDFSSNELIKALGAGRAVPDDRTRDRTVDIRTALNALDEALPPDRTVVVDGGRFMYEGWRRVRVSDPRWFVHTSNFGSIGMGLSHAIGAYFGRPDHPVVLLAGDGGFMLGGLAEFNTAVRHGVDLVVVVLNDGAYGAEHIQFRRREMDPVGTTFDWPDLGPVGEALGGEGLTVRGLQDLSELAAAIQRRSGPLLIDVKLDPFDVPNIDLT